MTKNCLFKVLLVAIAAMVQRRNEMTLAEDASARDPKSVREILWVWGNPEMTKGVDSEHTCATFAEASPARRAELLGTPNVLIAGDGIPNDHELAQRRTASVKQSKRIVWEIMPDGEDENLQLSQFYQSFEYRQRAEQISKLKTDFRQIEAIALDDMTSVAIGKGFKPEHIRALKQQLADRHADIDIWGVVYTMNLGRASVSEYINELDVINLWTWSTSDLVDLRKNVDHCKQHYPEKPVVLGLYLYDYGHSPGPSRMPLDLLKSQCETALKLAHEGRIAGIMFLTIDNDPEAVEWTANWIKSVADQRLGNP